MTWKAPGTWTPWTDRPLGSPRMFALGRDELLRIEAVLAYAVAHPIVGHPGGALATDHVVHIPGTGGGAIAVFSISAGVFGDDPSSLFRHLSISVGDGSEVPPLDLIEIVAIRFGFTMAAVFGGRRRLPGLPFIVEVIEPYAELAS